MDANDKEMESFKTGANQYFDAKIEEAKKKKKHCFGPECSNEPVIRCCFYARYCSRECQVVDWEEHSLVCINEESDDDETLKECKED